MKTNLLFFILFLAAVNLNLIAQNAGEFDTAFNSVQTKLEMPKSVVNVKDYKAQKEAIKKQVSFEENKGQVIDQYCQPRPDVLYYGQSEGMVFHIRNNGISYQLNRVDSWKEDEHYARMKVAGTKTHKVPDQITNYRVDVNWLNANKPQIVKSEALPGFNNYYNIPDGIRPALNVKQYKTITLKNLWDGVDMMYYSKDGYLESDWLVQIPEDYKKIAFEIKGAELSIEKDMLVMKTPLGEIREGALKVYQGDKEIVSRWVIEGNNVRLQILNYDKNQSLQIDPPTRVWGTYYGGGGDDYGYTCTTDSSGNVYMAGATESSVVIATIGGHQGSRGGGFDAFLVKFNSSGVREWGTYYGGTGVDWGYSCATDGSGNISLAGYTASTSAIATVGSHQPTYGGGSYDAFLVQFNGNGVRQWGTYYGGTGDDRGYSCTSDGSGNVYLTGTTFSPSAIATVGSHQPTQGGNQDAFLVQFNSNGVRQWGTYYGGTGVDWGRHCATDGSSNVYLTGETSSISAIATPSSHQNTKNGSFDAFLVQFNSNGVRQWGTYYGAGAYGYSCATDGSGNVYLTGTTFSPSAIATVGSHQPSAGGNYDAFLVQFNSNGVRQWGTYYGGSGDDYGYSCATDGSGNVYLTGTTTSSNAIITVGSHQSTYGGGFYGDAFLVKFNSNGLRQWGTYYGGSGDDYGYSCTHGGGNMYLMGYTNSTTAIGTSGSHQSSYYGFGAGFDVFLTKFTDCPSVTSTEVQSVCDSITWINGLTYTSSTNTPTFTIANGASNGCDSIVTLNLTILNSATIDTHIVCDSLTWIDNVTYTSSTNTPTFTLLNVYGCDSVVTLNLTILNSTIGIDTQIACDSLTWIDNITYTSGTNTPTFTLTNAAGCDSVVTLNLTILNSATGIDTQIACDSLIWIDGLTYTSSTNTPTFNIVGGATNGCDSVVTLNLTINNINASYTSIDNGGGNYTFTNTSTGSFTQTHWAFGDGTTSTLVNPIHTFNANGTFVVVLTINDSTTNNTCMDYYLDTLVVTGVVNPVPCAAGFVMYPDGNNNVTVVNSSTGNNLTYFWDFGDGDTSTMQFPSHTYATAGPFYLCLTVNDGASCVDTYCDSIGINGVLFNKQTGFSINVIAPPVVVGVDEQGALVTDVTIYPNPTTSEFIVELVGNTSKIQLSIVSIEGKTVYTNNTINTNKINVDAADWSKGVYIVKITDKQSSKVVKLVKQ